MTSVFAQAAAAPGEIHINEPLRDLPPRPDEARMFLSEIAGPRSEEEFTAGCAHTVLPGLSAEGITAAPWTEVDGNGFYLQGFHDGDPSGLVSEIADRAGWSARTLVLQALSNPFGLPGGKTTDCEMPYNKHAIGRTDTYKSCSNGHRITNNHDVTRCPVCSKDLK
jgi:hypothetical protein